MPQRPVGVLSRHLRLPLRLHPPGNRGRSVDHFAPKSQQGAFEDVLDPFETQTGWFVLETLYPSGHAPP
jgi:hypothetical protein